LPSLENITFFNRVKEEEAAAAAAIVLCFFYVLRAHVERRTTI
jgi:hypothetical protein